MRRLELLAAGALLGFLSHATAIAQSLDYGDFEGLFDEPVTVSATGKPQRISDTAVTMDVITAEDIKRSGARDLASLLRILPGISAYRGFNGIRDFSIGSLFLNGREIYLTTFGDVFLPAIPVELEEIRQIEVIRGPQSALYGFNAGEGVINIITFDPAKDGVNSVNGRVGNDARRDGSMILTQKLADKIGLRLTAAHDHAHYDEGWSGAPYNAYAMNPERGNLSANFSAFLANGDHATAEISHSDISLTVMAPQVATEVNSRLQSDTVKTDYSADSAIGRVTATAYYTAYAIPQASTPAGGNFSLHDHTIDGKIGDLFKATPEDSLRFELEYRYETVRTSNITGAFSTHMAAGSAMWDHQFGPSWSLVNAVRYYSNDSDSSAAMASMASTEKAYGLAFNSSLIYKLDGDNTLRGAVSRGIALPSQLDFEQLGLGSAIGQKIALANDPNLSRSPSLEYRLSWDHQLRDLEALARISLFTKQSVNAVELVPVQLLTLYNPACANPLGPMAAMCAASANESGFSGIFDGVQLQIDHGSHDGWRWGANYSIEQLHPHATAGAAMLVPSLRDDQLLHKINGHLGYGWSQWTADLRLFYSSKLRSLTLETLGLPNAELARQKEILSLSPHLAWMPREDLTIDLAAENLWPYRENLLQRVPASYFLAAHLAY